MDIILSIFFVLQSKYKDTEFIKEKDEANIDCRDTFDPDNRTVSLDDLSKGQRHELEQELEVENVELME